MLGILLNFLIVLVILSALFYIMRLIPVPVELAWLVQIIKIVVVVVFAIWVLTMLFGVLSGAAGGGPYMLFPYRGR
jgi:hypothetical protein